MTEPVPHRRPPLKAISQRAGVSKATVDRVIHNRPGVQSHTRQHVLSVMAELRRDVVPRDPETGPGQLQLDFVIPDRGNAFLADQARQLEVRAQWRQDVAIAIHRPAAINEEDVIATLNRIGPTTRAVGLVGPDSQRMREALRNLCGRGIPVVTLASDIRNVPRTAYIGIDNHAAGRLAGYLTGRLLRSAKGDVTLILGSRAYRGHEEREMGFRSVLRERFPGLRIVGERDIHEDADQAYKEVCALLADHDNLSGIYCIGAGQPGVAKALVDENRADSVLLIGHGLSADTRRFLADGVIDVVIDESTRDEADAAIDVLVAAARGDRLAAPATIAIQAIFSENLPVDI